MYLPDPSGALRQRSMITTWTPLSKSHFSLDTSGVSGFFGGDEAVSAMGTFHVYKGLQYLGWYNTPGSFQIARRYGLVAKSTIFRGLFPGVRTDLAKLFEFDGWEGPRFQAVSSGTIMDSTGHLASVLMKECASMDGVRIPGRERSGAQITIVTLREVPPTVVNVKRKSTYPTRFAAIITIAASLSTCIISGVYLKDWFSSPLILFGMLSNGISCLVIGSGTLRFTHHETAPGCPPGDGILGSGREFVLLKGHEGAVSSITLGKFSLQFPSKFHDQYIGCCSVLLTTQFIAQLFLIPQASLMGQIMFITSLAVSWVYNLLLSTSDKEKIQRHILLDDILKKPSFKKYILPTRTSAVVFAICALKPDDPSRILKAYLPNETKVWKRWRNTVLQRLRRKEELHFTEGDWNLSGYTKEEKELLCTLYGDAQAAYDGHEMLENKKISAATSLDTKVAS
ncbi:hypothetical protein OG21DRAFT_785029 [Imleria badia]|nr:hypothetical protein OG21DRAFT_785029 [Imleria badia]